VISGLEKLRILLFSCGYETTEQELSVTEEVLAITSYGNDFQEVKKSYQNIDKLHFDKMNLEKI
jgi:phosphoribosylamine--glycine ligase